MSAIQPGQINVSGPASLANNPVKPARDMSLDPQSLASQINASSNGYQQGLLLQQIDQITGSREQTNQIVSAQQPSLLAQAKTPNSPTPTTDFKSIGTTNEFQKKNLESLEIKERNLADGQFIGSDRNGQHMIYSTKNSLSNVPYISPRDEITGVRTSERPNDSILFTNGISTTPNVAGEQAQMFANMTNNNTRVVYSNTEVPKQAALLSNPNATNPAVLTMSREIQSAAKQGKSLHLFGHSGGATTINNALNDAKTQLRKDYGYNAALDTSVNVSKDPRIKEIDFTQNPNNKVIDTKIENQLRNIKVETTGSPVSSWKIDGPKYVHWVNTGDMVGAGGIRYADGGKNAVYMNFTSGSYLDGTKPHNLDRYLNVREDQGGFDKIYNQYSGKSPNTYPTNVTVEDSYKNRN